MNSMTRVRTSWSSAPRAILSRMRFCVASRRRVRPSSQLSRWGKGLFITGAARAGPPRRRPRQRMIAPPSSAGGALRRSRLASLQEAERGRFVEPQLAGAPRARRRQRLAVRARERALQEAREQPRVDVRPPADAGGVAERRRRALDRRRGGPLALARAGV